MLKYMLTGAVEAEKAFCIVQHEQYMRTKYNVHLLFSNPVENLFYCFSKEQFCDTKIILQILQLQVKQV